MTFHHPDPLLTDKEAAAILGVSQATFWRWRRDGALPMPVKLGRLSRWPRSEILEFLEKAKAARCTA